MRRAASAASRQARKRSAPVTVKQELKQEPASVQPPRKRAATTAAVKRERPAAPADPPRDPSGRLIFPDAPDFRPRFTPAQVIAAGSFGGIYFNRFGGKPGILKYPGGGVPIDVNNFPAEWFEGLPVTHHAGRRYNAAVNKFGVVAGQDQEYWESKGWMCGPDKRGHFQWYCNFFLGRRCDDDARQIARWKGVASDTGRWRVTLANRLARAGLGADAAARVSPVICQVSSGGGGEGRDAAGVPHRLGKGWTTRPRRRTTSPTQWPSLSSLFPTILRRCCTGRMSWCRPTWIARSKSSRRRANCRKVKKSTHGKIMRGFTAMESSCLQAGMESSCLQAGAINKEKTRESQKCRIQINKKSKQNF